MNPSGTFHYDKGYYYYYYYFRQVDGHILLGGGRNLDFAAEATTEPGLTGLIQKKLVKLLREVILPSRAPHIDYRWSSTMAFGAELEPIIQPLALGVFGALRCNNMSVRTGKMAAKLLSV